MIASLKWLRAAIDTLDGPLALLYEIHALLGMRATGNTSVASITQRQVIGLPELKDMRFVINKELQRPDRSGPARPVFLLLDRCQAVRVLLIPRRGFTAESTKGTQKEGHCPCAQCPPEVGRLAEETTVSWRNWAARAPQAFALDQRSNTSCWP